MRPLPLALLTATLLAAAPAAAEQPGWVDPPAKGTASTPQEAAKKTAKPEAAPRSESAERKDVTPADTAQPRKAARAAEAPPRRPKAAEVRRERRMTAARHETPQETPLAFTPDEAGPRAADRAGTAQRLAAAYLDAVSAPGAGIVSAAPRFYGERVRFHGRVMTLSALMAEKSRFARRWPERRYTPHGGMRTRCEGETCTVHTAFDFRAGNPARSARSQGTGELTLTIAFEGRPRIVSESSHVVHYGGPVLGQAERSDRGA